MKLYKLLFCGMLYLFITPSIHVVAQKAVLYNFDFRVPDAYRHEIQNYDDKGKKKYRPATHSDSGYSPDKEVKVLDKYLEPVSKEEAQAICESAAEMLKRKYDYTEITMMYPGAGGSESDKLSDFPNKGFKNAVKKNKVDAFITMEFNIENKALAPQRSLYYEEAGNERTIFINVTLQYIIFNAKEEILGKGEINLNENLAPLFGDEYSKEFVDKGFKIKKLYLTKEEIMSIYHLAEKTIETTN